jgi:glycosyltransferase involved in cell wall biosynthesis
MTRTLQVSLLTLGDPATMTGGYLYHQRIARVAGRFAARVRFASFPDLRYPLPTLLGGAVLARAAQADIALLDSICAHYAAPWLASRSPRTPMVALLHQPPGGIDHGILRTRVQRRLDIAAYRRCAAIVLASAALRAWLPEDLARRALVVPPGRDGAAERPPAAALRGGRKAALLCVGNWVERKGIIDLLEAFACLPDDAATLHLVGEPWVAPSYGARVWLRLSDLDLVERVVVHGAVSGQRLGELYGGADVFVLPSRREPYGTVYGEALAHGLPVVGWRAGNLPHLASDGVEGIIVAPGDERGLAEALLRLCEDADTRLRMSAAARRRAELLPTWEESAATLFAALRGLAEA